MTEYSKYNIVYRVIFSLVVYLGATTTLKIAWNFSDIANALMAIPNLIGVITLSGTVMAITNNYAKRIFKGDKAVKPMLSFFEDIQREQEKRLAEED